MFKTAPPKTEDFRLIYDEHACAVRNFLFRMGIQDELDDVVQETFIKVFGSHKEFGGKSALRTWIFSIALNTARDYHRKRKRSSWLEFFNGEEEQVAGTGDLVAALSEQEEIQQAIAGLSPKLREVVILFCVEDWELQDIAETLNIPLGTVKSRLHQARSKLENLIEKGKSHAS